MEAILGRLMPPALSGESQAEIENMIDGLAGAEPQKVVPISSGGWIARWAAGGGIAAALGLLGALYMGEKSVQEPRNGGLVQEMSSNLIVVSETDRVESVTDEGLKANPDGSTMRAVRLKAVETNKVLDKESGMIIEIREPREELLLTPINKF
jgi:hypothetical protein